MTISRSTDIIILVVTANRDKKLRQVISVTLNTMMQNKKISKYRLSKNSGIPYSTLSDILDGRAQLEKCSAETVYKLSRELQVPMETLLAPCFEKRCGFELFKSNVCHQLKSLGDIDFIIQTLENNKIREYYDRQWYPECFYLLAMLDYISRVNNVPLCDAYNDLRKQSLQETIYPLSIVAQSALPDNDVVKQKAKTEAIPEFMRFNIVESEIRNVI